LRGRVYEGLNLIGGVTWLDPELKNSGNATTSAKLVVSVPRWQANLFVEYDLPQLTGLSVNANLHYASARAANVQNTTWADAYATLDLGARYTTLVDSHKLTFRASVSNVADTHYWAAILPETVGGGSSQAGAASTVYAAFLGAPRVFHASATAEF
jgi:iron complex outermembrane receptor protein